MYKTLGQYLDDTHEFFWWLTNTRASFLVLNTAIESGLLNKLGDEAASIEDLSADCGIPSDKLERLVNFMIAEEIIEQQPDGKVKHTARSRKLTSLKPSFDCSVIGFEAGFHLYQAMLKGVTSYEYRYGKPVFEHLDESPETTASFTGSMAFLTTLVEDFIFTQHTFKPFDLAVDIGGNHGGLLLKLLERHPESKGILFDRPEVTIQVADIVTNAEHGNRIEVIGGDFFKSVPSADLYLLKMILHDWNDEECVAILKNIRTAASPGGRVAVIDFVLPETPSPHPGNAMDIAMMVWSTGKERKLSEFKALFDAADFSVDCVTENPNGQSVVEAVAV